LQKHPSFDVGSVKSDLDKIKTGMADTGSSISKLENTNEALEKRVKGLSVKTRKLRDNLHNLTVSDSVNIP